MAWMRLEGPEGPGYEVGFDCCDEEQFDGGRGGESGEVTWDGQACCVPPGAPGPLRAAVVLQEGTFDRGSLTSLVIVNCQLQRVPLLHRDRRPHHPPCGRPTLRALDMRGFKNGSLPDFMDKAAMGGVVRMVC
jgi:hypothetical protein